jgi:DNA-binding transcriptional LysR family regulator
MPFMMGLKVFEAASRHLNFTRAAAELSVTQTAVSHQVKGLEDLLGIKLFVRNANAHSVKLTVEGEA